MIGWAITPQAMRSPMAELTRTLGQLAAAGVGAVELPIDAAPALPVAALRRTAESLGLMLNARVAGKPGGLSAGDAFGVARDLGCGFLAVDALDASAHRRWRDASQETGVTLVLGAAGLEGCSLNGGGVQTKVLVELVATNDAARSGSALLRAAGERLGCVRLVAPGSEAGDASSLHEREWAAALAGCAYSGPIICSAGAAFKAPCGALAAARRLLRRAEKIEWQLSFAVHAEAKMMPRSVGHGALDAKLG